MDTVQPVHLITVTATIIAVFMIAAVLAISLLRSSLRASRDSGAVVTDNSQTSQRIQE